MHLKYCMMDAGIRFKENRHPQVVMKELGITYQHATPQSIADQWWFWNCEVPAGVRPPGYISRLKVRPTEAIGNGLDKKTAEAIQAAE